MVNPVVPARPPYNLESGVVVVIASVGRPALLESLMSDLAAQTVPPVEVVISVPTDESMPLLDDSAFSFTLTRVTGSRGAAAQRNAGIDEIKTDAGTVIFFDDDAIPRSDYIAHAASALALEPSIVGLTGRVVVDGASEGRQVSRAEALAALAHTLSGDHEHVPSDVYSLYGCNMVVKRSALDGIRFDERLPLYSWLEDLDMARRLSVKGRLARCTSCVVAHLGSESGGRTEHLRFGYSQVANPLYLWRKGTVSLGHSAMLVVKPLARNMIGSFVGGQASWRRERFRGNVMSVTDVLRGRLTPERIESLSVPATSNTSRSTASLN